MILRLLLCFFLFSLGAVGDPPKVDMDAFTAADKAVCYEEFKLMGVQAASAKAEIVVANKVGVLNALGSGDSTKPLDYYLTPPQREEFTALVFQLKCSSLVDAVVKQRLRDLDVVQQFLHLVLQTPTERLNYISKLDVQRAAMFTDFFSLAGSLSRSRPNFGDLHDPLVVLPLLNYGDGHVAPDDVCLIDALASFDECSSQLYNSEIMSSAEFPNDTSYMTDQLKSLPVYSQPIFKYWSKINQDVPLKP